MKAVLMSIHPKYCELIFNREKTIEVRRSCPKLETPFEVLVYATKRGRPLVCGTPYVGVEERLTQTYGYSFADAERLFEGVYNGKVIGSFVCDRIISTCCRRIMGNTGFCAKRTIEEESFAYNSCLPYEEIIKYAGNERKEIYGWHISDLKIYDKPKKLRNFGKKIDRFKRYSSELGMCSYECGECEYFDYPDNPIYETGECCADRLNNGICPLIRPPQSWCYVEDKKEVGKYGT